MLLRDLSPDLNPNPNPDPNRTLPFNRNPDPDPDPDPTPAQGRCWTGGWRRRSARCTAGRSGCWTRRAGSRSAAPRAAPGAWVVQRCVLAALLWKASMRHGTQNWWHRPRSSLRPAAMPNGPCHVELCSKESAFATSGLISVMQSPIVWQWPA